MINIIFFSLLFAMFTNFTMGAISLSGVNRTFLTMYRGILESSIAYVDVKGNPSDAYFLKYTLKEYVKSYLKENLTRYVTDYTCSIYYFNRDDGKLCVTQYCQCVEISLDCEINYFFHYTKARNFYINSDYE